MTTLNIRLNSPQTKAFNAIAPHSTTCLAWGRGAGKSWFERFFVYQRILAVPTRAILLAPTFKQARDVHGAALESELGGQWSFLGAKINRTTWHVDFENGSTLQLFGAENAQAARGLRCDVVVVDEADDIDPSVYDGVVQPWCSEPWSQGIRIVAGTPRRGRFGLLWRTFRRGIDGAPERLADHTSIHATAYDVPETVSQAAVERARIETPPGTFKREWLCDFDSGEALVYELFNEGFHVREPPSGIDFSEHVVGLDHGYEDPAVFIVIGLAGSGRDTVCWVLDEYYQQHKTPSELIVHAGALNSKYYNSRWYADPSRPDLIEEYKRSGIRVERAKNAIEDGVLSVADRLLIRTRRDGTQHARLYIHPRCHNTIREFGLYRRRRDPRDKDRVLDSIEDKNNHAMDAIRYGIFTRFGGPPRTRTDHADSEYDWG